MKMAAPSYLPATGMRRQRQAPSIIDRTMSIVDLIKSLNYSIKSLKFS